jgi:hypothetical protein
VHDRRAFGHRWRLRRLGFKPEGYLFAVTLARASRVRIGVVVARVLIVMLGCWASAAGADELYRTRTIVTGQGEANRGVGFARALEAVLVKVSGDPRLIGDARAAEMRSKAGSFVEAFRYRDRLAGIPVHDEQGTRDRPYDLFVDFHPGKIEAALRSLGRATWPAPRPRLAVFLRVENGPTRYLLASDGDLGRDQREALAAAAEQLGLPLVVPRKTALADLGLSLGSERAADAADLLRAAKAIGGEVPLAGSLVWSEQALGWKADWRLALDGRTFAWRISGVSFDEAFRNAMRGAAQILSGNGEPR